MARAVVLTSNTLLSSPQTRNLAHFDGCGHEKEIVASELGKP
jgi:hypothetical protein